MRLHFVTDNVLKTSTTNKIFLKQFVKYSFSSSFKILGYILPRNQTNAIKSNFSIESSQQLSRSFHCNLKTTWNRNSFKWFSFINLLIDHLETVCGMRNAFWTNSWWNCLSSVRPCWFCGVYMNHQFEMLEIRRTQLTKLLLNVMVKQIVLKAKFSETSWFFY